MGRKFVGFGDDKGETKMKVYINVDNKYDLVRITPNDMKKIKERHNITGYPTCWAILNDEFVVWPNPSDGVIINVIFD